MPDPREDIKELHCSLGDTNQCMLPGCHELDLGVMDTEFAPLQTSIPEWLMTYLRQIADVHYSRKLNRMYVHMLESFLAVEPWKAEPPFEWRMPRAHRSGGASARTSADPGWVPMNMQLPNGLVDRLKAQVEIANSGYSASLKRNLSMRAFLYTAVCWWSVVVYPYEGPGLINSN